MRPLKCRQFAKLCECMEADHSTLIQHTEIWCLSRGKVLSLFHELREKLLTYCLQENLKDFVECLSDDQWSSKLAYLADIFNELNLLNSGMQGRNENILSSTDKINAFQKKLTIWKNVQLQEIWKCFQAFLKRTVKNCTPDLEPHGHFVDKSWQIFSIDICWPIWLG